MFLAGFVGALQGASASVGCKWMLKVFLSRIFALLPITSFYTRFKMSVSIPVLIPSLFHSFCLLPPLYSLAAGLAFGDACSAFLE